MKILIVGLGSIGERHLQCFLQVKGVNCSVCEPRKNKLQEIKNRYKSKIDRAFCKLEASDLSYFDGVVICAPPHLHISMATQAAESGCHVLIEKPLSHNLNGIDKLIKLKNKKGLVIGMANVYRNDPVNQKIKELIKEKRIGKARLVVAKGGQDFAKYRPDYKSIYFAKKKMGGGTILDGMSHGLNLMEWFFGKEREICCFYDRLGLKGIETEDTAIILLRYKKDNVMVEQHENRFQKGDTSYFEIIGDKGTFKIEQKYSGLSGIFTKKILCFQNDNKGWETIYTKKFARNFLFVRQAKNFINAIKGKENIKTSIEEGLHTLKICLLAKKSYDTGKIIRL